jgi:hypothetical protein
MSNSMRSPSNAEVKWTAVDPGLFTRRDLPATG